MKAVYLVLALALFTPAALADDAGLKGKPLSEVLGKGVPSESANWQGDIFHFDAEDANGYGIVQAKWKGKTYALSVKAKQKKADARAIADWNIADSLVYPKLKPKEFIALPTECKSKDGKVHPVMIVARKMLPTGSPMDSEFPVRLAWEPDTKDGHFTALPVAGLACSLQGD